MAQITPKQRQTLLDWLARNPANDYRRPIEVWPEPTREAWRHLERCRRLIRDRVLVAERTDVPERERRYRIAVQYLPPPTC